MLNLFICSNYNQSILNHTLHKLTVSFTYGIFHIVINVPLQDVPITKEFMYDCMLGSMCIAWLTCQSLVSLLWQMHGYMLGFLWYLSNTHAWIPMIPFKYSCLDSYDTFQILMLGFLWYLSNTHAWIPMIPFKYSCLDSYDTFQILMLGFLWYLSNTHAWIPMIPFKYSTIQN